MIHNMTGGGGGGINLRVVGGTSRPGGSDTLYWDGNTEGLESVAVDAVMFYKVSDALPSHEDIVQGGTFVQTQFEGEQVSLEITDEAVESGDGYTSVFYGYILVVRENNSVVLGSTFPSKGIYFQVNQVGYVSSFQINGYTFGGGSVKDNTIWVNTETAVAGWIFAAAQPDSIAEGMVWIKTAAESTTPLNIDKKNTVMLYPQTVQQYEGGAWVGKTAQVYTGGEWRDLWDCYYYKAGEVYAAITGGYSAATSKAAVIFNSNNMVIGPAGTAQDSHIVASEEPVDLTGVDTLIFDCQADINEGCFCGVSSTRDGYATAKTVLAGTARAEKTLDVSAVTGEVYILFRTWYNSSTSKGRLTVYNVRQG